MRERIQKIEGRKKINYLETYFVSRSETALNEAPEEPR
jgi:hypothetical protein